MFDWFISTHIHYTMSWATVDQASSSPDSWIGAHWARRAHTPPMGPWRLVPKCRDQDEFDEFWSIPIAVSNSSFPFISIHFPWLCRNPEAMIRKRWQSRPWPWSQDSYSFCLANVRSTTRSACVARPFRIPWATMGRNNTLNLQKWRKMKASVSAMGARTDLTKSEKVVHKKEQACSANRITK